MHTPENINKQIVNLTIPNIISNFSIPLLGAVDTALMGRLASEHYLGAVGIGGIIFSFIYWGFGFLRMATTGLTAQAFGEKNLQECGRLLLRAVYIGITASLLLLIFQRQLADVSFSLINTSLEVEQLARAYFYIRIYAAPATLCLHAFHGVFFGAAERSLSTTIDNCGELCQYRPESCVCAVAQYESGRCRFGDCHCTICRIMRSSPTLFEILSRYFESVAFPGGISTLQTQAISEH